MLLSNVSIFFLQLLIGFESGTIVQWDLRAKKADFRIYYDEVSATVPGCDGFR